MASSLDAAVRKVLADESKDITDELSDFKLSLSNDKDVGTTTVEVLVTFEFKLRFFGGKGGGDSFTVLLRIAKHKFRGEAALYKNGKSEKFLFYLVGSGGFGGGASVVSWPRAACLSITDCVVCSRIFSSLGDITISDKDTR